MKATTLLAIGAWLLATPPAFGATSQAVCRATADEFLDLASLRDEGLTKQQVLQQLSGNIPDAAQATAAQYVNWIWDGKLATMTPNQVKNTIYQFCINN